MKIVEKFFEWAREQVVQKKYCKHFSGIRCFPDIKESFCRECFEEYMSK